MKLKGELKQGRFVKIEQKDEYGDEIFWGIVFGGTILTEGHGGLPIKEFNECLTRRNTKVLEITEALPNAHLAGNMSFWLGGAFQKPHLSESFKTIWSASEDYTLIGRKFYRTEDLKELAEEYLD